MLEEFYGLDIYLVSTILINNLQYNLSGFLFSHCFTWTGNDKDDDDDDYDSDDDDSGEWKKSREYKLYYYITVSSYLYYSRVELHRN